MSEEEEEDIYSSYNDEGIQAQEPLQHRNHPLTTTSNATAHPNTSAGQPTDDDFFSLDMVTDDMDFEQAYSAYNSLQQKQAINAVEHLKKVQILNQQYDSSFGGNNGFPGGNNNFAFEQQQQAQQQQFHLQHLQQQMQMDQQMQAQHQQQQHKGNFDFHRTQILQGGLKDMLSEQPTPQPQSLPVSQVQQSQDSQLSDDFDHFFSNTESSALEKFLDNLANPSSNSPQQHADFYTHQPPLHHQQSISNGSIQSPVQQYLSEGEQSQQQQQQQQQQPLPAHHQHLLSQTQHYNGFDLNGMKPLMTPPPPASHQGIQNKGGIDGPYHLKNELTEAFSHPPSIPKNADLQLPTPVGSNRQSPPSFSKRKFKTEDMDEFDSASSQSDSSVPKKKKRSTTKQLLTLEQKRLNHSFSEQKRRQLCKLAYERCLSLIINLDEYISLHKDGNSKTVKKKQKLKDGLPNISKHTALAKISNEILTIQQKNNELQKLLMA